MPRAAQPRTGPRFGVEPRRAAAPLVTCASAPPARAPCDLHAPSTRRRKRKERLSMQDSTAAAPLVAGIIRQSTRSCSLCAPPREVAAGAFPRCRASVSASRFRAERECAACTGVAVRPSVGAAARSRPRGRRRRGRTKNVVLPTLAKMRHRGGRRGGKGASLRCTAHPKSPRPQHAQRAR